MKVIGRVRIRPTEASVRNYYDTYGGVGFGWPILVKGRVTALRRQYAGVPGLTESEVLEVFYLFRLARGSMD